MSPYRELIRTLLYNAIRKGHCRNNQLLWVFFFEISWNFYATRSDGVANYGSNVRPGNKNARKPYCLVSLNFLRTDITERASFLWQVDSGTLDNSVTAFRTVSEPPYTQEAAHIRARSKRGKNMGAKENTHVVSPALVSRAHGRQGRQLYYQQSGQSIPTTQTTALAAETTSVAVTNQRRSLL